MKKDLHIIITLMCIVSLIFVLRDSDTSPAGFLKEQVKRILDDNTYTQKYCSGINLNTAVSSTDANEASDVRASLNKIRNGNPLITFIESTHSRSQFITVYLAPVIAYAAPWVVFFVITLVACIGFIINWCCMYAACCKCCCQCCKEPKTPRLAKVFASGAVFFGVATIGVAIAGIIVSRNVGTGGSETLCAAVTLISQLIEGQNDQNWIGVQPLADKMVTVLNSFDSTMLALRADFPLSAAVSATFTTDYTASGTDAQYNIVVGDASSMYTTYKGQTISRSDPSVSSTTYVPDYIANLGADTNSSTYTGMIEAEFTDKKTRVQTAASTVDTSMTELLAAQVFFRNGLEEGKESAQNTSTSMQNLYNKIDSFGSKAQTAFNAIGNGLLGLFVLEGALALFAMLAICLVCRGAKFFNKGIHLTWCCIALLTLLTWILAAVTFPTSIILFEVCDASNLFINNSTFFNQTFDKFLPAEVTGDSAATSATSSLSSITGVGTVTSSTTASSDDSDSTNKTISKARNILYNCLFAEQNMLKILNLSDTLAVFNNLMEPYDTIRDLIAPTVNTNNNSVQIPIQEALVANYESGLIIDGAAVTTDLNTLNTYTNSASESCTTVQDTWVANSADCTSSMGTVFLTTNAAADNVGKATCIGFDAWGSQDITVRYTSTQYPSTCSMVGSSSMLSYVQSFVNNFISNRGSVSTLFGNIESTLTSMSGDNDRFMTSIKLATKDYPTLINDTAIWYPAITDKDQGVFYNAQCTFVKGSLQTVHDVMCTNFIVKVFQSTVTIIIVSFFAMFGCCSLFCLSKRFTVGKLEGKPAAKGRYNY